MDLDELAHRARDAADVARRWERREVVAFWPCLLLSGATFSERPWLRAAAATAFAAWALALTMRWRASRAEARAYGQWFTAFYRNTEAE